MVQCNVRRASCSSSCWRAHAAAAVRAAAATSPRERADATPSAPVAENTVAFSVVRRASARRTIARTKGDARREGGREEQGHVITLHCIILHYTLRCIVVEGERHAGRSRNVVDDVTARRNKDTRQRHSGGSKHDGGGECGTMRRWCRGAGAIHCHIILHHVTLHVGDRARNEAAADCDGD